ncbi:MULTISPECIES: UPF0280 family protein [Ramlibacter]|uniref:UPF0280 family protein n=1 Tax=Ramlibacter pinisoli TaxID=2682844 RepID=A0A6N8IWI7_9BURK|nr:MULTISPECIES: UPF0280 family protein [Ramlibacter]MBA2961385.1 UPF0280 family protein [Ramlibacter sp. CGMCC 1.13660]MVQ31329.1 UPF0280 family protein [Ramlibacter pinisoli]
MSAQRQPLSGQRWHFQHGPIDIVIGADGEAGAVQAAHEAAWQRFRGVLDELVAELPLLRQPVGEECSLAGPIARRMWQACQPYRAGFITPMAAVAGAVAQELAAFYRQPGIARAWVNNGGDIALHLAPGEVLRVGLFADLGRLQRSGGALHLDGDFRIHAAQPVRGIATSGWRGRSFSLGIADSVTVLARTAAQADAAATVVANAVDVDDPRIRRRPACELKDDTDLGELPVTVDVPALGEAAVRRALARGAARARELQAAGLIESAVLACQGWFATADHPPTRLQPPASAPAAPERLPA